MSESPRLRVNYALLLQLLLILVSVALAYGRLNERISLLEDRYLRTSTDISEIKSDVKELLRRQ